VNRHGACVFHARATAGLRNKTGLLAAHGGWAGAVPALVLGWLLSLATAALGAAGPESRAVPNHTLPTVAPPPQGLAFSASPTVEEIFRARVFEEPLVPIGGEPSAAENADLSAALRGYAQRNGPDDFSTLTRFLDEHPQSPWRAALLTGLGLEYYNTAHYSLCLEAWKEAWMLGKNATDANSKSIGDRAGGELAYLYAKLGRTTELEALLKSVEGRVFSGPATERITGAREGLWTMKHRPEIAFRCGPLALHRIALAVHLQPGVEKAIYDSASTPRGCSLPQVAELSQAVGLNYQMAYRPKGAAFVVPAVVHWKVGHYAAIIRKAGDRYLVQDPTFLNDVWVTEQALEAEASGYFLIQPGPLPVGWRTVEKEEGDAVWGKGYAVTNDPRPHGPCDPQSGGSNPCDNPCPGMAASSVHLMLINLNLRDTPVGYSPPMGPPVQFEVRYNHRDAFQPSTFTYSNFGSKWTCDWIAYITDNPSNTLADVNYYIRGGGTRTFTGFDTNAQTYAFQQYDQTALTRSGPASYEMLWPDGSKLIFSQSDGSVGTSRKIFLTQVLDPFGNAVELSYDGNLRLVAITDAIGQATILTYGSANDMYKITKVTDPFGRSASFVYDDLGRLTNITDVIGLSSQFSYETNGDFIQALTTPYGTTRFIRADSGNTRVLETLYPDGSRDRVEYNQQLPPELVLEPLPKGMGAYIGNLNYRDTYYWSRNACALGYGDYSKARIYHWLHAVDAGGAASSILESTKEPLEGRVWFDYAGQGSSLLTGVNNRPLHVGRVLDDGTTQLYTFGYNGFGKLTNSIDPVGRTFSYLYASNGIDLLEVHMTRSGKNELLYHATYNSQHLPLTTTGAAGQTNFYTYNSRGQPLTATNAKNETTTYSYDTNGYLVAVMGPLGTNDVTILGYDAYGRIRSRTDVSGYTMSFEYDAMDRMTKVTYPDSTFEQTTYNRLDPSMLQDRAGRQTLLEYDAFGQLTKWTDPLGRVTRFQWCSCGDVKSITDPMGRTTSWLKDVQDRLIAKQFGDGSQITYSYENTISRLREVKDEKQQFTSYSYNLDDSINSIGYANTVALTPAVSFTYDPDYRRVASMTDGTGTTLYQYVPITVPPVLGGGKLASETGPLPNSTITYSYDELGRKISTAIDGVASTSVFDAAGRVIQETNALGSFSYTYDGASHRRVMETFPNGQTTTRLYGNNLQDFLPRQIIHQVGPTPLSQFLYSRDIPAGRITSWSEQFGTQPAAMYTFDYDSADQLVSSTVTNSGVLVNRFAYAYDLAGNRLNEQDGGATNAASYNALNQLSSCTCVSGASRTNEWDGADRLTAVSSGSTRTEFTYDGLNRLASIRYLTNGIQASLRRFLWCDDQICEERDSSGGLIKRFFRQGMKVESGANAGLYYYTRDHLGSIRELTDASGGLRAHYSYAAYGSRTRLAGNMDADFGFADMFWTIEAGLNITWARAYDPALGRWLSRDRLPSAELTEGPNLYTYARNNPVNNVDPLGLCCEKEDKALQDAQNQWDKPCGDPGSEWSQVAQLCKAERKAGHNTSDPDSPCQQATKRAQAFCDSQYLQMVLGPLQESRKCWKEVAENGGCKPKPPPPPPPKPPPKCKKKAPKRPDI
jgi:RHS repeat-associated protein